MTVSVEQVTPEAERAFQDRLRTANRIFRGALIFNAALTMFWLALFISGGQTAFYRTYTIDREAIGRIAFGILFFNVAWGFIWYGIKSLLLRYVLGMPKGERRQVFSSRMDAPFDVAAFLARYPERTIRIIDMIGRRGRFITLGSVGFFLLYSQQSANPTPAFALGFIQEFLFDAVVAGWVFLAFYYANGFIAAAMYGPQSRVMDGVLARANCLLITTLWAAFRFVMVPIGAQLNALFQPREFAVVFTMIWGSYMACDAFSEIGGSLFGRQKLRVWGIGDVNRKSIAGTITGLVASLVLCIWVVQAHALPPAWIGLAIVISLSNTALELWSPRGTDDFTMATANALLCWAFGAMRA